MSYDATKPAIVDNYSTGYTQKIRDNLSYLLTMGEGDSISGTPPTYAKRYDPSSDLFQYYTGSGWATLPLAYLSAYGGTINGSLNVSGSLQRNGANVWATDNFNPSTKANVDWPVLTGDGVIAGTFSAGGRLFGNGPANNNGIGRITISSSGPSGGAQGDIHFQV